MLPASFNFDLYPFIAAIGILLALFLLDKFFKINKLKKGMSTDYEILITISAGLGFIFAILFQNLYDLIENPATYKWTWAMTFFGGLVGGVSTFFAGYFLFMRKKHPHSLAAVLLIAGAGIPLAHGIGRIGCTLDGCCYGGVIEADSPFYWMGIEFRTTPGVKVWPTQLMEAIFLFILAGILLYLAFKKRSMLTMPIYCMSYGIWRFLIEFLRGDHRGDFIPGITPSQFWSIFLFIGGVVMLIILIKTKKLHLSDYNIELQPEVKKDEVETVESSEK